MIENTAYIQKKGDKYCVRSKNNPDWSGGCYDTKAEAEKRLNQVEMFKHMKKANIFDIAVRIAALGDNVNVKCKECGHIGLKRSGTFTAKCPICGINQPVESERSELKAKALARAKAKGDKAIILNPPEMIADYDGNRFEAVAIYEYGSSLYAIPADNGPDRILPD